MSSAEPWVCKKCSKELDFAFYRETTGPFCTDCMEAREQRAGVAGKGSAIEEAVISRIRERAQKGLAKYGTTMERTDLSQIEWLRHAQEEALDLAVYLERLIVLGEEGR